jgi:hypothetical protein
MRTSRFEYISAVTLLCLITAPTAVSADGQISTTRDSTARLPSAISHTQIYSTTDGETHFREATVALTPIATAPPAPAAAQSELQPATTIRHAVFPANWGVDDRDHAVFHAASSRRFVTIRSGVMWVKVSDGQTRRFQKGDVIEVLDIAPSKGHITWVGNEPVVTLLSNHP